MNARMCRAVRTVPASAMPLVSLTSVGETVAIASASVLRVGGVLPLTL